MHRVQWEQSRALTGKEVTHSDLMKNSLDVEKGEGKAWK